MLAVHKPKECLKPKPVYTCPPVSKKNGGDGPAKYNAAGLVRAYAGVASVLTIAILGVDQPSTAAIITRGEATPSHYHVLFL
jgi:hypothetical protein